MKKLPNGNVVFSKNEVHAISWILDEAMDRNRMLMAALSSRSEDYRQAQGALKYERGLRRRLNKMFPLV